jgi:hypothetical protein
VPDVPDEHDALFLGVALLSVAVHYVMLQAEFLAAMQVLVYVGGVLILVTFAVMLTRAPDTGTGTDTGTNTGTDTGTNTGTDTEPAGEGAGEAGSRP